MKKHNYLLGFAVAAALSVQSQNVFAQLQQEETYTGAIRPGSTTTWTWDGFWGGYEMSGGGGSGDSDGADDADGPSMSPCDTFECVHMMTNCASDFATRKDYALGVIGAAGIGETYNARYPGPPYTHHEHWTVQFRFGSVVGIASHGCLVN